jgi:tripartite-type tricarboxylate transporter receptor subunit TctC
MDDNSADWPASAVSFYVAREGNRMGRRAFAGALCAVALAIGGHAAAQEKFPSRNINVIVPITAGSAVDILARLYADRLPKVLGVPVLVTNRPGGSGIIAAQAVLSAPPDGYTLEAANFGHSILGALNKNLPFDPVGDFAGLTMVGETPTLITVSPALGVRTLDEFVKLAKAKPGSINYGTAGPGTTTHIAGAYFAQQAGIEMVPVTYRSSGDLLADLMAGRIQAFFAPPAATLPLVQEGKVVALAISNRDGMSKPITVPSARASGIDYEYMGWYGFLAPAKTPPDILKTLDDAIRQVGEDEELRAKIEAQGITPRVISLRDFDAHIAKELNRIKPVLEKVGESVKN